MTVDDDDAQLSGNWKQSSANGGFVGAGYRHDDKSAAGPATATFVGRLPSAGSYNVRLTVVPNANRSRNALVSIHHGEDVAQLRADLSGAGAQGGLLSLGVYRFPADPAKVVIINESETGYVLVDVINWQVR